MAKRSSAASPDEYSLLRRNISELKQLRTFSHPKRKESVKKNRKNSKKPPLKKPKYFTPVQKAATPPEEIQDAELSTELSFSKFLDSDLTSNNDTNLSDLTRKSTDTAWLNPPNFNSYPLANDNDNENSNDEKENKIPRPPGKKDPEANIKSMYKAAFQDEKLKWKQSIHEEKSQGDAQLQDLREEI